MFASSDMFLDDAPEVAPSPLGNNANNEFNTSKNTNNSAGNNFGAGGAAGEGEKNDISLQQKLEQQRQAALNRKKQMGQAPQIRMGSMGGMGPVMSTGLGSMGPVMSAGGMGIGSMDGEISLGMGAGLPSSLPPALPSPGIIPGMGAQHRSSMGSAPGGTGGAGGTPGGMPGGGMVMSNQNIPSNLIDGPGLPIGLPSANQTITNTTNTYTGNQKSFGSPLGTNQNQSDPVSNFAAIGLPSGPGQPDGMHTNANAAANGSAAVDLALDKLDNEFQPFSVDALPSGNGPRDTSMTTTKGGDTMGATGSTHLPKEESDDEAVAPIANFDHELLPTMESPTNFTMLDTMNNTAGPPRGDVYDSNGGAQMESELQRRGLQAVFDPSYGAGLNYSHSGGAAMRRFDPSMVGRNLGEFLMTRTPRGVLMECHVQRVGGLASKFYPKYVMRTDSGFFFMAAQKRKGKTKSSYVISMSEADINAESMNCLGKVKSNFMGSEFVIQTRNPNIAPGGSLGTHSLAGGSFGGGPGYYQDGSQSYNPHAGGFGNQGQQQGEYPREEVCAVTYSSTLWGKKPRGPRKMSVIIPRLKNDAERFICRPIKNDGSDGLLNAAKMMENTDMIDPPVEVYVNRAPKWNEQLGAFVLNFNKRVTQASVKNFQLINQADPDTVILQFGRVGKEVFNMDFRYPLSPFQAFAIVLSSFDYKLCCE